MDEYINAEVVVLGAKIWNHDTGSCWKVKVKVSRVGQKPRSMWISVDGLLTLEIIAKEVREVLKLEDEEAKAKALVDSFVGQKFRL